MKNIPLPTPSKKAGYGEVILQPRGSILSTKGRRHFGRMYQNVTGSNLPTFESLRQRGGLMLYETIIYDTNTEGELKIAKPRDTVYVYVDGVSQLPLYYLCPTCAEMSRFSCFGARQFSEMPAILDTIHETPLHWRKNTDRCFHCEANEWL